MSRPTESTFGNIDIPNVDLWAFLMERKDKEFPDDKGRACIRFLYIHADLTES